jgi:type IV secretory pathway TraG/TraD family ATPase VirD4
MLVNMTNWSEEHYKYNAERYIQRLCNLLELSEVKVSFGSLTENISSDKFILLSKQLSDKGKLTKKEHLENKDLAKASGDIAEGAAARFAIIRDSRLGQIFDDSGIDIYTALKENAIILFILNPLLYPEMSPLIGRLIIIDSKKAISLFYQDRPKRIFFLLDEINVYVSTAMLDLVNKSRSANVTCILATQSLSDLDSANGEAFKEQILENCNNYLLLRQNTCGNAEYWASTLGTKPAMAATYQIRGSNGSFDETELGSLRRTREFIYHPDDIKQLKTGKAIYLSRDDGFHCKIQVHKPF